MPWNLSLTHLMIVAGVRGRPAPVDLLVLHDFIGTSPVADARRFTRNASLPYRIPASTIPSRRIQAVADDPQRSGSASDSGLRCRRQPRDQTQRHRESLKLIVRPEIELGG